MRACNECGSADNLHLDHNHTTGKVRGVLCSRCNVGVGQFLDDPMRLMAAADYLIRADEMTLTA
jgi:hypothetical protein